MEKVAEVSSSAKGYLKDRDRIVGLSCYERRLKPIKTEVFNTYWRFAVKRQEIFFARLNGECFPWTNDPILYRYKFTNAYRASDRVSQYLIKNVIYSKDWGLADTIFRILIFKIFNKIETWELLENSFGEVSIDSFDIDAFDKVLERARSTRAAIYSAAYIMPSGGKGNGVPCRKHRFHLELINHLLKKNFPLVIQGKISMEDAYHEILQIDSFGKFLSYQFVTDINYSKWFQYSESEFVVPGPGARDGIKKCFSDLRDYSEEDAIRMMMDEQEEHFDRLGLKFKNLWGRPLQLIDCQNLFCEVDKYSRVAHPDAMGHSGRTRIKQIYRAKPLGITAWYPPKWGLNEKIKLA